LIVNVKDQTRLNELKRLNRFRVETENALSGVERAILAHSNAWHETNDEIYKQKLHEINNILRSTKKGEENLLNSLFYLIRFWKLLPKISTSTTWSSNGSRI